jgi:hypothetical protein
MRDTRRDTLAVGLTALVARVAWVVWANGRFPAAADGVYYDALARRLAHGDGYTWAWPDGAVTFAAHYPVGYPAILALAYVGLGASVTVAGLVNAAIGSPAAVSAHRLLLGATTRGRAYAGAVAIAIHPALVPYTSAIMTEGVTAALLVAAAAVAGRARASMSPWRALALAGLVLGVATLVRPQSLLLAPLLGALALRPGSAARGRVLGAVLVTCATLACCLPWTARNCARMHRCALVSVNGGWNLLIGAQTETGGWAEIRVPEGCRTVWDEAQKDACFEHAARDAIAGDVGAWIARIPDKLAVTFDAFAAAPWYLHASNEAAFSDVDKTELAVVETIASRLGLVFALVAAARTEGPRRSARGVLAIVAVGLALSRHAWPAYLLLLSIVALLGKRRFAELPLVASWAAVVVGATAIAHAVFFGAGRYGLVTVPLVTALAFCFPLSGMQRARAVIEASPPRADSARRGA